MLQLRREVLPPTPAVVCQVLPGNATRAMFDSATRIQPGDGTPVTFARDLQAASLSEVSLVAFEFPRIPSTAVADV